MKKYPVLKDNVGSGYVRLIVCHWLLNLTDVFVVGFLEEEVDHEVQESAQTCKGLEVLPHTKIKLESSTSKIELPLTTSEADVVEMTSM